jgi:hypothetical protein
VAPALDKPCTLQLVDKSDHCRPVDRQALVATADETMRTAETYVQAGFTDVVLMLVARGADGVAQAEDTADLLPKLRELG